MGLSLEDEVDDSLRDRVGESQVGTGDGDEAEDDGRGLGDLTAVGPLDALQLGPGGPQEVGDPVAARTRARGGARRLGARRRSRGGRRGPARPARDRRPLAPAPAGGAAPPAPRSSSASSTSVGSPSAPEMLEASNTSPWPRLSSPLGMFSRW